MVVLVGVCILSAAVGSGITLLAKTGPQGQRGPVGPAGPRGESAQDASYEAEEAAERAEEAAEQASELDQRLSEVELKLPGEEAASWSDLNDLEWQVQGLEATTSTICRELGIYC